MQNKVIVCLLIFPYIFDKTFGFPLLNDVLKAVNPLASALSSKKGSKMELLDMLTNDILKTPDGGIINQGDIVRYRHQTKAGRDDGDLWPNGRIPYNFHPSVDSEHKNLLKEAMKHWEQNTCIKFKKANKTKDKHYIRFRTDTAGCWSAVGRQFDRSGPQDISLGSGCFKFYTAIHEIGHTLGYYHEHARKDRDQFVEILWDNVKPGMNIQFEQRETRNDIFEYDYRSIMHYPAWAFSKSPLKINVILSKNPFIQYLIDEEKNSLSFRDIKLTNTLYKCEEKCPNLGQIECKNGGMLSPNKTNGKNCTCLCPPGFNGDYCENEDQTNHIDLKEPKCGGNITGEGLFTTPNYPLREEYESCSYWITAPINHRVSVTFDDFSFADPYGVDDKEEDKLCLYESVEIRKSDDIYRGSIYCGQQIEANTVMESDDNHFIIIIIADDQKKGRGLKARVKFINKKTKSNSKKKLINSTKNDAVMGLLTGIGDTL